MDPLAILFPRKCLGCQKTGCYFCPSCLAKIRPVLQICPVCQQPSACGLTHSACQTRFDLDGLFTFFAFQTVIRQAIHKLKYRLVTDLKNELFSVIFREWDRRALEASHLNKFIDQNQPIVIPVPLYWYKENQRGFNQSSLFGQAIAQKKKLSFSDKILLKKAPTPSQTTLSPQERKENVQKTFSLSPKATNSPPILLIDDVWTTGATLKTAASLLKHAGSQKVWSLTIAR